MRLLFFLFVLLCVPVSLGSSSRTYTYEVSPALYARDGVVYFSVTSDGTTGDQWIARLEKKGIYVGKHPAFILRSSEFKPTNGVTSRVAVLKGMLWDNENRFTQNILTESFLRRLEKPNLEIACLIREKFSNEEIEKMGLSCIVVMHEPVKNVNGDLRLLGVGSDSDNRWLVAFWGQSFVKWNIDIGFAFVAPQK